MAKLDILIAPHPTLKTVAKPVPVVDDRLYGLSQDMLQSMYDAKGIGLAAPQIGVSERLIVMDLAGKDEPPDPKVIINPELLSQSADLAEYEEGCLSFPDQFAKVVRPAACTVRYTTLERETVTVEADGITAVCLQHEIDHLNGILFTDHLSALRRNMLMRRLAKWKKANAA